MRYLNIVFLPGTRLNDAIKLLYDLSGDNNLYWGMFNGNLISSDMSEDRIFKRLNYSRKIYGK